MGRRRNNQWLAERSIAAAGTVLHRGFQISRRKAYTAAALGISTAQPAKNIAVSGITIESIDPELIAFGGGFPICCHDVVIGAIGVDGADRGNSDEPNEACAQAGLHAIKSQLDR